MQQEQRILHSDKLTIAQDNVPIKETVDARSTAAPVSKVPMATVKSSGMAEPLSKGGMTPDQLSYLPKEVHPVVSKAFQDELCPEHPASYAEWICTSFTTHMNTDACPLHRSMHIHNFLSFSAVTAHIAATESTLRQHRFM